VRLQDRAKQTDNKPGGLIEVNIDVYFGCELLSLGGLSNEVKYWKPD
jgi:hypothetical protein